jgi:hypothetical protein
MDVTSSVIAPSRAFHDTRLVDLGLCDRPFVPNPARDLHALLQSVLFDLLGNGSEACFVREERPICCRWLRDGQREKKAMTRALWNDLGHPVPLSVGTARGIILRGAILILSTFGILTKYLDLRKKDQSFMCVDDILNVSGAS